MRPIETLRVDDLVVCEDGVGKGMRRSGFAKIRWIGQRKLTGVELSQNSKLRPICIKAGALCNGIPKRDLFVSPQHRILVRSRIAERMFGQSEVLVAALRLTKLPGIFVDKDTESITYFHILFEKHEIIFAEGAPSESLFTGPEALKSVGSQAREEILSIFPEITSLDYEPVSSRLIPNGGLQKRLVERHLKNRKPLIDQIQ